MRRSCALKSEEEVQQVFNNIGALCQLHQQFATLLEERINEWNENSIISDLFIDKVIHSDTMLH